MIPTTCLQGLTPSTPSATGASSPSSSWPRCSWSRSLSPRAVPSSSFSSSSGVSCPSTATEPPSYTSRWPPADQRLSVKWYTPDPSTSLPSLLGTHQRRDEKQVSRGTSRNSPRDDQKCCQLYSKVVKTKTWPYSLGETDRVLLVSVHVYLPNTGSEEKKIVFWPI